MKIPLCLCSMRFAYTMRRSGKIFITARRPASGLRGGRRRPFAGFILFITVSSKAARTGRRSGVLLPWEPNSSGFVAVDDPRQRQGQVVPVHLPRKSPRRRSVSRAARSSVSISSFTLGRYSTCRFSRLMEICPCTCRETALSFSIPVPIAHDFLPGGSTRSNSSKAPWPGCAEARVALLQGPGIPLQGVIIGGAQLGHGDVQKPPAFPPARP